MKREYPYHYDWATGLYAKLADQDFWKKSIAELIGFANTGQVTSVLDAGCGHGLSTWMLAEAFPKAAVTGIDISRNMIRRAERSLRNEPHHHTNIAFKQSDAAKLPFEDASFELITGHSFLYMLRHREPVLKELYRVLRPGGCLVCMEPGTSIDAIGRSAVIKDNFRNPKPRTKVRTKLLLLRIYSTRKGQVTPREMESEFQKAGFTDFTWKESASGRGLLMKASK